MALRYVDRPNRLTGDSISGRSRSAFGETSTVTSQNEATIITIAAWIGAWFVCLAWPIPSMMTCYHGVFDGFGSFKSSFWKGLYIRLDFVICSEKIPEFLIDLPDLVMLSIIVGHYPG